MAHIQEKETKDGTHVAPRGFFESLFYSQPPEGKGVRLPLDKLRNNTPVFLGMPGTAEFLYWHIPWALEPCKLAMAGPGCWRRASNSQPPPCLIVQNTQCAPEGVKNRSSRGVERDPRGKREGQSNFLGDSPFLSPSQNPTPTPVCPFFLTCTLSASMCLSPERVYNIQSPETRFA